MDRLEKDESEGKEITVENTIDVLAPQEKALMLKMLDLLMCPGFPLDGRCLNKRNKGIQIKITTSPGTYLQDAKDSTFPISEHLSPQEFLKEAGFSAFQARSVCENKKMMCKLTAAIKEARVWLNRMTKNQALLLYGLSVKMFTKEMPPLFLQLTEAIVNNRIVNMMQLFEYLKLMKVIGRLPLQSNLKSLIEDHEVPMQSALSYIWSDRTEQYGKSDDIKTSKPFAWSAST